jgi:hypothetical protein
MSQRPTSPPRRTIPFRVNRVPFRRETSSPKAVSPSRTIISSENRVPSSPTSLPTLLPNESKTSTPQPVIKCSLGMPVFRPEFDKRDFGKFTCKLIIKLALLGMPHEDFLSINRGNEIAEILFTFTRQFMEDMLDSGEHCMKFSDLSDAERSSFERQSMERVLNKIYLSHNYTAYTEKLVVDENWLKETLFETIIELPFIIFNSLLEYHNNPKSSQILVLCAGKRNYFKASVNKANYTINLDLSLAPDIWGPLTHPLLQNYLKTGQFKVITEEFCPGKLLENFIGKTPAMLTDDGIIYARMFVFGTTSTEEEAKRLYKTIGAVHAESGPIDITPKHALNVTEIKDFLNSPTDVRKVQLKWDEKSDDFSFYAMNPYPQNSEGQYISFEEDLGYPLEDSLSQLQMLDINITHALRSGPLALNMLQNKIATLILTGLYKHKDYGFMW